MDKPEILNFFDYREYLIEVYKYLKATDPTFSYRRFTVKSGLSSPNYFQRIISGQRDLSLKYVPQFNEGLNHSAKEANYFLLLVQFRSKKSSTEKEKILREILHFRMTKKEFTLQDKKLKFYNKWYYAVVRELILIRDFGDDFNKLANCVVPKISAVQAKSAVNYLLKNGFIKKESDGCYSQVDPIITTGPEVNSVVVQRYHKNNLLQSAEAIDTIPREERDVSSLTLSVSNSAYQAIKKEIQDFRKRLLSIAESEQNPEKVCLVAFQLLPRSKTIPGDNHG